MAPVPHPGIGAGRQHPPTLGPGVVEGAATVRIAQALARRNGIDMPIVDAVHAVVDDGKSPEQEIARLLSRPLGPEIRQG